MDEKRDVINIFIKGIKYHKLYKIHRGESQKLLLKQ